MKYGMAGCFEYKGVLYSNEVHTEEKCAAIEVYDKLRPDDIIIITYPKSGK